MSNAGIYANLPENVESVSSGEAVTIETVIANKYRARQMDSFRYAKTIPKDWIMCEIKGITDAGEVQYEVPEFPVIRPFSSLNPEEVSGRGLICELCGHEIKYPVPIRANAQSLVMWIGSDCVNNYMGAGYVTKKIKIFKDTQLRNSFEEWLPKGIRFCDSQREHFKPETIAINWLLSVTNPKAVECNLCHTRVLNTDEVRVLHQKICKTANATLPAWMLNRVPTKFYKESQALRKLSDVQKLSSRKILNALITAQSMRIPLSPELEKALEVERTLMAIRLTKKARKSSVFPCITEPDGYPYAVEEDEVANYREKGYEVRYVTQAEYDAWMKQNGDSIMAEIETADKEAEREQQISRSGDQSLEDEEIQYEREAERNYSRQPSPS